MESYKLTGFSTALTLFSTLIVYCTSGLRWNFNWNVEKCWKIINHSTDLTVLSTVFTVEKVENFSPICTNSPEQYSEPHIYADFDEKITTYSFCAAGRDNEINNGLRKTPQPIWFIVIIYRQPRVTWNPFPLRSWSVSPSSSAGTSFVAVTFTGSPLTWALNQPISRPNLRSQWSQSAWLLA